MSVTDNVQFDVSVFVVMMMMMMWVTLLNHLFDDFLVMARSMLLLDQNLLDDWLNNLDDFVADMNGSIEMLVNGLLVGDIGRSVEVDGLWLVDDRRVIDAD